MRLTEPELLDMIASEAIIDRAKLTRNARLDELGVSSMDVMSLLFEVEERFDVTIEGTEMPPIATLGEMVDYLLQRVNVDGAAA